MEENMVHITKNFRSGWIQASFYSDAQTYSCGSPGLPPSQVQVAMTEKKKSASFRPNSPDIAYFEQDDLKDLYTNENETFL